MFFTDLLFGQAPDEILVSWPVLLLLVFHWLFFGHPLLELFCEIDECIKIHTLLPALSLLLLGMVTETHARPEILWVVLSKFWGIKETWISHAFKGVVFEHWVEIKWVIYVSSPSLKCWTLELLLELRTKYSIKIIEIASLVVTDINVIMPNILLHVVRINLVTKIDSYIYCVIYVVDVYAMESRRIIHIYKLLLLMTSLLLMWLLLRRYIRLTWVFLLLFLNSVIILWLQYRSTSIICSSWCIP